jgi:hypothetical protein
VFDVDVCPYHHAEVIFVLKRQIKRTITLIHAVKNLVKSTGHLGRHLIFLICTAHHGKKLGRGPDHFRKEGARLNPPPTELDPYEDEAYRLWQIKRQGR